jgi:hypothetical protein
VRDASNVMDFSARASSLRSAFAPLAVELSLIFGDGLMDQAAAVLV